MYAATSSNWGPQVQWRLLQLDTLGAEHSEAHRRERRRTIVRRWSELGCWEELSWFADGLGEHLSHVIVVGELRWEALSWMTSLYVSGALLHVLASSLTLPVHLADFSMSTSPTKFDDSKGDRERLVLAYTYINKACAAFIALASVGICLLYSWLTPFRRERRPVLLAIWVVGQSMIAAPVAVFAVSIAPW